MWGRWLAGQKVNGMVLWGLRVLWWGRIGKLLQFAAVSVRIAFGLTVTAVATTLAKAFGRERADYRLRLAAFLLFLLGFHFDLLAS